ncbi:MAG: methionine--tRNA ligase [Crocinitomicaceae bacterium]|nr:methionine--tRNA ligase [Crocinitomicaceae bacterium]|tara:strand:- start:5509 stop:7533 length:2025 start_codon:yes stop_codon:yes gene_type:complete
MTKSFKRHLVTSALPYANGPLHLGHLAGAYLPADIYVRYLKSRGENVAFICGSDEHGAAITLRAKKEGKSPQEIVDNYHHINKKAFEDFGINFDYYDRTSSKTHHETAQDFFKTLDTKGCFDVQKTEQYFDEENQQFLADRYISGECPNCHSDRAYGDQCENCGTALSPKELINPKSTISGNSPVLKETSHWFLPMEKEADWLKEWIVNGVLDGKQHHSSKEWRKHVVGQCLSWIDGGLHSRAMTRDLDWGVKVPAAGADGKVLYVWLDAPIGYISATKKWAEGKDNPWEDYWKSEDTALVHFIGKDNIVFHCIIFPILLKLHGGYNLPVNVPANQFLNLEGDKISTSRNWAVWLHEYLEDLPGRQDELRYVLTSIAPESKDSEFTWKDYQARVNNELVAILGNFVNRVIVLTNKYYDGQVPEVKNLESIDEQVLNQVESHERLVGEKLLSFKFREAQAEAMNIARAGNKYLADEEPWKKIKTDPERTKTIMAVAIQICKKLEQVFVPFLPETSDSLNKMFGNSDMVVQGNLLFQKVEDNIIQQQIDKLKQQQMLQATEKSTTPQKENISFDEFVKMDIRVGTILEAEKVPKADKLLKLIVDTGIDKRTVVSGIAEHYTAEEIIGKKVSVLLNLAPRKIRGVESQGMILMAENQEGKLAFVSPEKEMDSGSEIR